MPTMTARPDDVIYDLEDAAAWHASILADGKVPFWVVSSNKPAYPGQLIARAWTMSVAPNGSLVDAMPFNVVLVATEIDALRGDLPLVWCGYRDHNYPIV